MLYVHETPKFLPPRAGYRCSTGPVGQDRFVGQRAYSPRHRRLLEEEQMNFDCGIYVITTPSGKQYIGQAKSFRKRWASHLRDLKRGTHRNKALQNSYVKYGKDSLIFSKIAFVPEQELDFREQEQIDSRNWSDLYNIARDAAAPFRGRQHSPESISKQAQRRRLAMADPQKRAEISSTKLGHKHTESAKAKMSVAKRGKYDGRNHPNFGKKWSEHARRKMSESRRARPDSTAKPVKCIELDITFPAVADAARWLRENGHSLAAPNGIGATCSGKRKSAYGYQWLYVRSDAIAPRSC